MTQRHEAGPGGLEKAEGLQWGGGLIMMGAYNVYLLIHHLSVSQVRQIYHLKYSALISIFEGSHWS